MAGAPGQHFTRDDYNALLAEIIKQASPQPSVLLDVVNRLGIQHPNFNDMPLPYGKSLNSCVQAWENLKRSPMPIVPGPLSVQTPSPMSAQVSLKRPWSYESPFPAAREIRPKPSSLPGVYGQPAQIEQPPRKKRGRPTKAEAQARQEAQTASAEPSPAQPTPSSSGIQQIGPPPAPPPPAPAPMEQSPAEPVRPSLPPVSRMPISSILTPTGPKSTSQSSSSSGRRRRGRSTRSEPEDLPPAGATGQSQRQQYESPYAGASAESQNTPARAAALRHPEGSRSPPPAIQLPSTQPPSTSEPEPRTM